MLIFGRWENCLCVVSKAVFFALFTFQNGWLRSGLAANKSVFSMLHHFPIFLKQLAKLFVTVYYFFIHFQVQSLYGSLQRSNFCCESQKTCVCDAYYHPLLSNFFKFPEAAMTKSVRVGRRGMVMLWWRWRWRWMRSGR